MTALFEKFKAMYIQAIRDTVDQETREEVLHSRETFRKALARFNRGNISLQWGLFSAPLNSRGEMVSRHDPDYVSSNNQAVTHPEWGIARFDEHGSILSRL